jgi:hypothetical protein
MKNDKFSQYSAAVIGLVLILAAYSIAGFVVSNLANAV